ncbi:MAG: hypothetical protein NXI18_18115 [Alphaproteobacteria bacterium]|nr:hypothetical protein [Alphaproteobacteria bacterium]
MMRAKISPLDDLGETKVLKQTNHITLACVSLVALSTAYGAVKVGVGFTHGNEPPLSREAKTIFALREWLIASDVNQAEVSDVSYWALVELFLTLNPLGMQHQTTNKNSFSNIPLAGQDRSTVCANITLDEPHKSEVISILNENPDVEFRTEDQAGAQYGVLEHYEECDVRIGLGHATLESYDGMVFDVMIGYNNFCLGWQVVYPHRLAWSDAPNLYRQHTLIC